ncbi:hypothetical protein Gpo141_00005459 [Globisporangium polare]
MFFANGYVEAEQPQPQQQRRMAQCSSEENDILRELLLDGDFSSPRHFALTPSKPLSSTPSLAKRNHFNHHHHVEISIPQICFDSNTPLSSSTLLRSTPSLLNRNFSMFPSPSPLSQQQQHQMQMPPSSIINSIISPPRVFIQEFAQLPRPFFNDGGSGELEPEMHDSKHQNLHHQNHHQHHQHQFQQQQQQQQQQATALKAPFSITSCLPPPPLPMLTMPPLKKNKRNPNSNKNSNNSSASSASGADANNSNSLEKKQLRCSYPDCPNLRRSAGFCNRHSGKVCNIAGCHKSALSRGKCPEHGGGSRCKKDGCAKFAQTRGLCKSHGGGRQCNITGCTKNAHQNRLCRSHGGGKRCDFYGCPKWAQRSGFCCAHTKSGPSSASSTPSSTHSHDERLSAAPSPMALPMPMSMLSPMLMSPHRLLSLLP